jgi:diguanylate cyclase (GGDEF)-like protein/PAS domain S-box-containing protein
MIDHSVEILLIEDNPGDARQVQEILSDMPGFAYRFEWAHRLSSGMAHLESNHTDVVLLDLNLADSTGYETYKRLHERFPDMPVILLTGLEDEQLGLRAVRDGAQDYLAKSNLEGNLLTRTIRYAMERKLADIALHKSELLLKKTFSCLNDAVFIINAQTMKIASCNPAASQIFGYSTEELVGKNALFLLGTGMFAGEQSTRNRLEELHSCKRGEIYERLLQRKNGENFFAEFSFEAIEDQPSQVLHWVVLMRDISIRKQAEETLKESEERYYLAARGANDGLWDWNIKKERVYYSPRWKDMLGYAEEEIAPTIDDWVNRIHPDDREAVLYAISNHLNNNTHHFESEHRVLHHDKSYRWMLVRGMAVRDANGIAYRMAGSQTDITDRKNAQEQLLHDAFHDLLTGLPNRALFLDRMERAIEYSRRHDSFGFTVLFLDLDRFKVINDSLGHAVGDQLLVEISRVLRTCLRTVDTVARFGGDEFVVLLDDIQDMRDAIKVVKNIQQVLSKPFRVGNNRVFTSASIGIVLSTGEYTSTEDIMRDADIAMYQAKLLGTANYVVFNTEMRNQAINRLSMENDLRHAVSRGELELEYQPIVTLKEKSLAGFEALARWTHPKKGNIPPEEFIPIAEETGLIIDLGNWVLRQACLQMCKWHEQFPSYQDLFINVNISRKQFAQPEFIQHMHRMLKETSLDPACLNLEITENVLMEDAEAMIEMLNKLRQLGVGLHIDDFGKGYSSLSYLQQFPIDTLKVDYTFINHIGSNGDHLEIVKTILVLARELGVDTIAEGIETENQLNQLRELDCHYGQGYYLGKPMRPEEVAETLKSRPKPCIPIELNQRAEVEAVNQLKVNPNLLRVPAWRK